MNWMNEFRAGRIGRGLAALLILAALLLGLPSTLAQEPPGGGTEPAGTGGLGALDTAATADDGGRWEVGVHHSACKESWDTEASTQEGWGLYKKLTDWCGWGSNNWRGRYRYGNTYAWEEDFKRSALGGKEHIYLDTVDLQFYVGHGGPSSFTFCDTSHDDKWLTPNDCYRSWGDNDNEWVALTSCKVLADSHLANWARCMKGTHLILGFKTNAAADMSYSGTQGYWFARYICSGYKVAQAWYKAADRSQPTGRVVRALINELDCLNDRPSSGYVCSDSWDWDAWVQTHTAGSEPARYVDVEALNGTMPVFEFAPFSLADAETKYEGLGTVFGITTTQHAPRSLSGCALQQADTAMWTDLADGHELEMDSGSGLYGYTDLNNLWTYTSTQAALSGEAIVRADDARRTADAFLTNNGLMPEDAQFYETISDTLSGGDIVSGTLSAMNASLLDNEQAEVWQVIYSRIIPYTPFEAQGGEQDTIEFSVVGPGAKQKVYVGTSSAMVNTLNENDVPILGAIGGWRPLAALPSAMGYESVETVDILTPAQIYTLHDQLNDLVSLNQPPIQADGTEIMTHTVAFWEDSAGTEQSGLIPVYDLTVSYTLGSEFVAADHVYIPANETYMRPFAEIASAPTEMVQTGDTIGLSATDASMTLAALGYDGSLDFALGYGFPDDYLYTWYKNSPEPENQIGVGQAISYTVEYDVVARDGGRQQTIILEVTDTANPDQLSTTASTTLDVYPRVFLPLVMRSS